VDNVPSGHMLNGNGPGSGARSYYFQMRRGSDNSKRASSDVRIGSCGLSLGLSAATTFVSHPKEIERTSKMGWPSAVAYRYGTTRPSFRMPVDATGMGLGGLIHDSAGSLYAITRVRRVMEAVA